MSKSKLLRKEDHYSYPGYFDAEAWCQLLVFERADSTVVALAHDPDESDSGTSITNAAEALGTQIWRELGEPRQFIFIEYYPANRYGGTEPETFARTDFQLGLERDGRYKLINPSWMHLTREQVEILAGSDELAPWR